MKLSKGTIAAGVACAFLIALLTALITMGVTRSGGANGSPSATSSANSGSDEEEAKVDETLFRTHVVNMETTLRSFDASNIDRRHGELGLFMTDELREELIAFEKSSPVVNSLIKKKNVRTINNVVIKTLRIEGDTATAVTLVDISSEQTETKPDKTTEVVTTKNSLESKTEWMYIDERWLVYEVDPF